MQPESSADLPWVLFRLRKQFFGVPVGETQEMLVVPEVTPIPRAPSFVRGVINLRGRVMPLIDLRGRLNMSSSVQEMEDLIKLLEQREEDHKNWLAELEGSLRDKRKFRLTTDPHQCAFGRWYDTFTTDNLRLSGLLLQFDAPHKRIHGVGVEVEELAAQGRHDEAQALINRVRDTVLAKLVGLFGQVRDTIRKTHSEIAVVVERGGRHLALTVDSVDSVETLAQGSVEDMKGHYGDVSSNLVDRIGRRQEGGEMVLLMDMGRLFEETNSLEG